MLRLPCRCALSVGSASACTLPRHACTAVPGKAVFLTVPMAKAWKDGGLAKPAAPSQSCKPVHTHRCEGLGLFYTCRRGATPKRADGPRGSARSTLKFRLSSKTKRLRELLFCCRHRLSTFLSGDNHARHCLASWGTHHCHSAAHAFWSFLSSSFSMHGCALSVQWPVQQIGSVLQAFFWAEGISAYANARLKYNQFSPVQWNQ